MADLHKAERVTLYPHGAGRELSTKMWDEWKRDLAVEYVRADAVVDLRALTDEQREILSGVVAAAMDANHGRPTLPAATAVVDALVDPDVLRLLSATSTQEGG
jgi:hypothetical protein